MTCGLTNPYPPKFLWCRVWWMESDRLVFAFLNGMAWCGCSLCFTQMKLRCVRHEALVCDLVSTYANQLAKHKPNTSPTSVHTIYSRDTHVSPTSQLSSDKWPSLWQGVKLNLLKPTALMETNGMNACHIKQVNSPCYHTHWESTLPWWPPYQTGDWLWGVLTEELTRLVYTSP